MHTCIKLICTNICFYQEIISFITPISTLKKRFDKLLGMGLLYFLVIKGFAFK